MITHLLTQTVTIVATATDKHGDQKQTALSSIKCRFRYITAVDKNLAREALGASQAIFWFEPGVAINETTILLHEGKYWRVERLVKARRMKNANILFLKVFVAPHVL